MNKYDRILLIIGFFFLGTFAPGCESTPSSGGNSAVPSDTGAITEQPEEEVEQPITQPDEQPQPVVTIVPDDVDLSEIVVYNTSTRTYNGTNSYVYQGTSDFNQYLVRLNSTSNEWWLITETSSCSHIIKFDTSPFMDGSDEFHTIEHVQTASYPTNCTDTITLNELSAGPTYDLTLPTTDTFFDGEAFTFDGSNIRVSVDYGADSTAFGAGSVTHYSPQLTQSEIDALVLDYSDLLE